MTMKITRIEEFVTAVPHIPSIEKSRPGDYQERPISVIKVDTDEGICGVGEGGRGGDPPLIFSQPFRSSEYSTSIKPTGGCKRHIARFFGLLKLRNGAICQ